MFKEITSCRSCGGQQLQPAFSLGEQYVVDFVQVPGNNLKAPLDLVLCAACKLLQLKHSVTPDRLFRKFWYRSGINEAMRSALRDVACKALTLVNIDPKDKVLDIGSNDGTLLSFYGSDYRTVGIDPCRDLVDEAVRSERQDVGLSGYFSAKAVEKYGPYKIITAVAMFYDVEDPETFLKECRRVLHPDGCIVIQMNYLKLMLENMAFDNVSHEHLCYYSIMSMQHLVRRCGLDIAGASINNVNGGSIRLYLVYSGAQLEGYRSPVAQRVALALKVDELLRQEVEMKLDTVEPYERFQQNMNFINDALRKAILERKAEGKHIYVYGASTRGMVLLQTLGLPADTFDGAADRDLRKVGLKMVTDGIPIVTEQEAREKANVFLLLPYHFWETVRRRERLFIDRGGEFIVPLPVPVLYKDDGAFNMLNGKSMEIVGVAE